MNVEMERGVARNALEGVALMARTAVRRRRNLGQLDTVGRLELRDSLHDDGGMERLQSEKVLGYLDGELHWPNFRRVWKLLSARRVASARAQDCNP